MTEATGVPIVTVTPPPAPTKPGWKTTEFWLTLLAIVVGALATSGLFDPSSQTLKIIGLSSIVLASLGYTGGRSLVKAAVILLVLAASSQSMACSASARQTTIRTAMASVDAASDAYVAFDLRHQQDILAQATDPGSGQTLLAEWRKRRSKVEAAFVVAYRAIALAATTTSDSSLQAMTQAASIVLAQLKDLGVAQ